ncbi:helix-turn-helix domain-containing protein, partial [Streptomyces sp. NPDC002491]
MSRWKALPEALDPQVRRLVVQLRQVKDHSGLSLAALASRTSYSRSSWERYLNGKTIPPRHAVETMAQVCGGDLIGLTALWEVAASAPARGARPSPSGPGDDTDADADADADADGPGSQNRPAAATTAEHPPWSSLVVSGSAP